MTEFSPVDDPADLPTWLNRVADEIKRLGAQLTAERALADEAAELLTSLEAVLHPHHPKVTEWLARYREARGQ